MNTPQLPQVARLTCYLLLIHLLISCNSLTSSELTYQDREYLKNVYADITKNWNAGNREPYLNRFDDNTILMVPNLKVISDLSNINNLVHAFPDINISFGVTEIWGSNALANVMGVYSGTDAQGNTFDTGKFISIWQKNEEGKWKITHDIWNSDLPVDNPIEGGWYLMSGVYNGTKRGGSEPYQFKLFTDKHYALLMQTTGGEWKNSTTGSYSLAGDIYRETIEFSNRPEYVGMTLDWKYEVRGDTLFMEGPLKIVNKTGEEVNSEAYNTMSEIRVRAK